MLSKDVGIDFLVVWLYFLIFEKVSEAMIMIEMTFENVYMNLNWKAWDLKIKVICGIFYGLLWSLKENILF